jgi:hypothetical protein
VAIGSDAKSIDVTVIGATGPTANYAPYRIAMASGPSDYYSSLRIVGTGLAYTQQSILMPTGADSASTARDVGVTVDNIFINTYQQAANLAGAAGGKWSSPTNAINITKSYINKPGETELNFSYATFADFDAYAATNGYTTFGNFDTAWSGQTFQQFDNYWYSLVQNDFNFQVFCNVNGARVQWRRNVYRIRSATITESQVTYTAEVDTTFGEFDASVAYGNPTMTFGQFDTLYAGLTFADFGLIPLAYVKPEYDA